ncbi:urease accessory protein UreD [Kaistia soli]|nr:urease accessory protein UreD [Kaistia soli]
MPDLAVIVPHSPDASKPSDAARMQRSRGRARVGFRRDGDATRLTEFIQEGCCKVRLPRGEPGLPPDAVLLNTAGGITGGDHLVYEADVGAGVSMTVTTQAAERIYRRSAGAVPARVENRIAVATGGHVDWLPQETILFDRSAITRSLEVELAEDATALMLEAYVFGRTAMGENLTTVSLADRWRVRRGGRLIYADGIVVDGDAEALLKRGATAKGGVAVASLVMVAPDAAARLGAVRARLEDCKGEASASTFGDVLTVRFLAANGQALRHDVESVILTLRGRPMPRVWSC